MGAVLTVLVSVIVTFFIMYWAVRLGVEHALEARDEQRAKKARATEAAETSTVEPDLES